MFSKKTKLKLTDFECNLLINGMNEFRNMLVLVIYVLVKTFAFFKWLVNKTLHHTTAKPKTSEEKLFDLMERHLGSIRKEIT